MFVHKIPKLILRKFGNYNNKFISLKSCSNSCVIVKEALRPYRTQSENLFIMFNYNKQGHKIARTIFMSSEIYEGSYKKLAETEEGKSFFLPRPRSFYRYNNYFCEITNIYSTVGLSIYFGFKPLESPIIFYLKRLIIFIVQRIVV